MPNTDHVELEIEDDLDLTLRTWITARLLLERGVHAAVFDHDDPHRLAIDYDAGTFSHLTLIDRVKCLGARGNVRVSADPSSGPGGHPAPPAGGHPGDEASV